MSDVNKSISINFCDVALKIHVDIDTYNELFLNSFLNLILIHSVNNYTFSVSEAEHYKWYGRNKYTKCDRYVYMYVYSHTHPENRKKMKAYM